MSAISAAANNFDYDVVIIGGGPGGYVAAIRAAQLGKKVAVVEKRWMGGVCLNIGCIPTKAIIKKAELFRDRSKLEAMGLCIDASGFNYETVFNASRKTADMLSKGVSYLLKKNGVDVVTGSAKIISDHEVAVYNCNDRGDDRDDNVVNIVNDDNNISRKISAGAIIIATGSRPKSIPGLNFDGDKILSSDDALMLKSLPKKALIIGAGVIGIEFAHIYNAFGVEVHVVETAGKILPAVDGEISNVVAKSFAKRGVKIYTSSKMSSHNIGNDNTITATIVDANGNETKISVDKIFVMTGRAPNSENIGIDKLGINTTNGFINVGDYYQTPVPSIYAIGDVSMSTTQPAPMLAHVASTQGEIAAEHIAGHVNKNIASNDVDNAKYHFHAAIIDPNTIPAVVYCDPQIAAFGITEEVAAAQKIPFAKATFPFRACGKAVAADAYDGMIKILACPQTKKILGAHIVGTDASELIHELLLAKNADVNTQIIASTIHAHPTLSEAVMEAVRALDGRAVHI